MKIKVSLGKRKEEGIERKVGMPSDLFSRSLVRLVSATAYLLLFMGPVSS